MLLPLDIFDDEGASEELRKATVFEAHMRPGTGAVVPYYLWADLLRGWDSYMLLTAQRISILSRKVK